MNEPIRAIERAMDGAPILAFRGDFLKELSGSELYLVGGAVRDAILGLPNKDFDFVVRNVTPDRLEHWLQTRGRVDLAGRNFGVFKLVPAGFIAGKDEAVDFAIPRTEQSTEDSQGGFRDFDTQSDPSLPIETDLSRRDFTMNAMAFEVGTHTLLDPFNGRADLADRVIRAVGNPDERFREDMTRMLRAIRFAAQLDGTIEPATLQAIQAKMPDLNDTRPRASDGALAFVAPREVVGKELAKALTKNPGKTGALLETTGALRVLFPDVTTSDLTGIPPSAPTAAVAVLLHGLPSARAGELVHETGLDSLPAGSAYRVEPRDVAWIVERLRTVPNASENAAIFERTFMNARGEQLLLALEALGHADVAKTIRARATAIRARWAAPPGKKIPELVTGHDVVTLGVKPGPAVRILLESLRSAQLEGELMTREAALERLREEINKIN